LFILNFIVTRGEPQDQNKNTFYLDIPLTCTTFVAAKLKNMVEIFLLSALIIAISVAFLCVKLLFKKDGSFSSQHIHDSEAMKKRGIHCVIEQDCEARLHSRYAVKEKTRL